MSGGKKAGPLHRHMALQLTNFVCPECGGDASLAVEDDQAVGQCCGLVYLIRYRGEVAVYRLPERRPSRTKGERCAS